jgi:hypothetical protein
MGWLSRLAGAAGRPGALDARPFHDLLGLLEALGAAEQAAELRGVLSCAWTSSSEMAGELGRCVIRIRAGLRPAHGDLQAALARCLAEVQKVWPSLR